LISAPRSRVLLQGLVGVTNPNFRSNHYAKVITSERGTGAGGIGKEERAVRALGRSGQSHRSPDPGSDPAEESLSMIVATDVLIWYLRGRREAAAVLDTCNWVRLFAVTYMELVQGMRNAGELRALRKTLVHGQWQVLPITEAVSIRAMTVCGRAFLIRFPAAGRRPGRVSAGGPARAPRWRDYRDESAEKPPCNGRESD